MTINCHWSFLQVKQTSSNGSRSSCGYTGYSRVVSGTLGYSRVLSGTWVTTPHVCLSLCCICQLATALASTRQRPQTRLAFHNIFISIWSVPPSCLSFSLSLTFSLSLLSVFEIQVQTTTKPAQRWSWAGMRRSAVQDTFVAHTCSRHIHIHTRIHTLTYTCTALPLRRYVWLWPGPET